MAKFPRDAPTQRVVKALESLGFRLIGEHEHISMVRDNEDGTRTPSTMPNHRRSKARRCERSARRPISRGMTSCGPIENREGNRRGHDPASRQAARFLLRVAATGPCRLVACQNTQRVCELDRTGKVVWEHTGAGHAMRARR
jgi:hypothetical protein